MSPRSEVEDGIGIGVGGSDSPVSDDLVVDLV